MRFPPLFWLAFAYMILAVIGCEPTLGPSDDDQLLTSALASPTPPSNSTQVIQHTATVIAIAPIVRELDPIPVIPSNWISTAESENVIAYLGEETNSSIRPSNFTSFSVLAFERASSRARTQLKLLGHSDVAASDQVRSLTSLMGHASATSVLANPDAVT